MNQPQMCESASISVFSNMAAYRAGFEDDEVCRVWARRNIAAFVVNFQNDEIPGWKAGKFVAYCVPCSKEAFEQGTQYSTHAVGGNGVKDILRRSCFRNFWSKGAILTLP